MLFATVKKYKFRRSNRRDNIVKSTWLELVEEIKDTLSIGTPNPEIRKIVQTDGKKLLWVRCQCTMHQSLLIKLTYKVCNWWMGKYSLYKGDSPWVKLFEQYYTESVDHPVEVLSREYYG